MKHLERALDNQNQWWKYLLVFIAGLLAANIVGALPLLAVIMVKIMQSGGTLVPNAANMMDLSAYGISQNLGMILILVPFFIGLITLCLLFKPFHKRRYTEVMNGTQHIRWKRLIAGWFAWTILMGLALLFDYLRTPGNFEFRFDLVNVIPLFFIAVLFIPFQTAFEELTFRGYLAQGVGAWTHNRLLVILLPSLLFGLMHVLNPEIKAYGFCQIMPSYILFGLIFGLVTVLDDGIELAIGAHAANNIFGSVVVTSKASVLQTAALFEQKTVSPACETLELLVIGVVFVLILKFMYKWEFSILGKRINAGFHQTK